MKFLLCLLCLAATTGFAEGPFHVGQKDYLFKDKTRQREIVTHVWYPVEATQKMKPLPSRNIFVPAVVAKNAKPLGGRGKKFPLVMISHGSGGLADKLFWLTDNLVRKGFLVVGMDHPGNNTTDNSTEGLIRIWDRAKDVTFVLDQVLKHEDWSTKVDTKQIGAVGHSAGGSTVLLLAGAKFSPEKFTSPIPQCAGSKDPYFAKTCEEIKAIDFKKYPKDVVGGDYSDSRITAIVAYDPGYARSYDPESLKKMKARALILIADKLSSPQGEIFSKDFLTLTPQETSRVVAGAYHFTFLQPCKAKIPKNIPELDDLCVDNVHRPAAQTQIAEDTFNFFLTAFAGR